LKIGGISNVSVPATGMGEQTDALTRSLQKQIEDAKKQIQEIASDTNLSDKEKMQKRQELQKKIAELNQQLKQHQMEQKREAREQARKEKESSLEDLTGGKSAAGTKGGNSDAGLSTGRMQAMISADSSMKQARVQGRTAMQMKGREGVLEIEIKLDSARAGGEGSMKGVDAKKEQLAETRARRMDVEGAQMQTLAEANKEAEKAVEERTDTDQTGEKQTAVEKPEVGKEKTGEKEQKTGMDNMAETKRDEKQEKEEEQTLLGRQESERERRYTHMDVRL